VKEVECREIKKEEEMSSEMGSLFNIGGYLLSYKAESVISGEVNPTRGVGILLDPIGSR